MEPARCPKIAMQSEKAKEIFTSAFDKVLKVCFIIIVSQKEIFLKNISCRRCFFSFKPYVKDLNKQCVMDSFLSLPCAPQFK